jgi:hypothetical protein
MKIKIQEAKLKYKEKQIELKDVQKQSRNPDDNSYLMYILLNYGDHITSIFFMIMIMLILLQYKESHMRKKERHVSLFHKVRI